MVDYDTVSIGKERHSELPDLAQRVDDELFGVAPVKLAKFGSEIAGNVRQLRPKPGCTYLALHLFVQDTAGLAPGEMIMTESALTFRVDEKLKEQFFAAARKQDRAGSQILREFMRKFVAQPAADASAYDEWFRASVQAALDDPRPAVPSAVVEKHFAKRRAAAKRKYGRGR